MPELLKRIDRPWISPRIPREWSTHIDAIAKATEPFETLFLEATDDENSATIFALQGLFCGSEHSKKAVEEVVGLAEKISIDHIRAKERGKKSGALNKELLESRERLTQLTEIQKRISTQERPLLRILMREMSLLQYAQNIYASLEVEQTFNSIQQNIQNSGAGERSKSDLLNILEWIRASELHKALRQEGRTTPNPEQYTDAYQPLYLSYTWKGAFRMGIRYFEGIPLSGTVAMDPTRNAWIMGSSTHELGGAVQTRTNISYNGELVPQGCYFLPLNTVLRNDGLYASLKSQVWRDIDAAVTHGLIKEYDPEEAANETSAAYTPSDAPDSHSSIEEHPKILTKGTRPIEDVEAGGIRKPTRVPGLLYRDYSRFFEACGAKLVGGGTHLRFEYKGRSVSALNNDVGRTIESAEIMQKLAHLDIPEEVYVEKIPGSAGKDLLARYKKTQK